MKKHQERERRRKRTRKERKKMKMKENEKGRNTESKKCRKRGIYVKSESRDSKELKVKRTLLEALIPGIF